MLATQSERPQVKALRVFVSVKRQKDKQQLSAGGLNCGSLTAAAKFTIL